jgi:hypothetical protein
MGVPVELDAVTTARAGMRNRWVGVALIASTLAACGDAATPTAQDEEPGPPGLPVAELLDSVAFVRAVRALSQSPTVPRPSGRVAIAYGMSNDEVSWIYPLWDPGGALADSLAAVIRRSAKPSSQPAAREGITLSIAVDATTAVSARASVKVEPRLINAQDIATAIRILAAEIRITGSWEFLLRLDRTGRVVEVRTQKKPSGDQGDRMASLMTGCVFSPATVDGFAVPIWVGLPVTI